MRRRPPPRLLVVIAASFASATSCHAGEPGAAVAALGTTVLLTGVRRAATGDCWASCGAGTVCNRERGLCERGECVPACPVGSHCLRDLDGSLTCRDDPMAFTPGGEADDATGAAPTVAGAGAAAAEAETATATAIGVPYAPWNDAADGGAAARRSAPGAP
ncbi:MAG TPA: hypothetical protein PLU22_04500 [Polyangiaceae bacterium]|nr:hypothetical protein [Polyangiaceae bacterium]